MFGRKRYYDEYEDDRDEKSSGGTFIKPVPATLADGLIALFISCAVFGLLCVLERLDLHPLGWSDALVANGMRPETALSPGLWRLVAPLFGKAAGVGGGAVALVVAGRLVLSAAIGISYFIFRDILSILIRATAQKSIWSILLARVLAVFASFALLSSNQVWLLGYAFTPGSLLVLLLSLAIFFFLRFIASGVVVSGYWCAFFTGLVCSESPLGFILMFAFFFIFYLLLGRGGLFHVKFIDPLVRHTSKWYMTFFWFAGFAAGIGANVASFVLMDGLPATGTGPGDIPLRYILALWGQIPSSANALGWMFGLAISAVPFVIALSLLRKATDIEYILSYHTGITYLALGALAYSQLATLRPLWFWDLHNSISITSAPLHFLFAFFFASVLMCTLAVAAVDVFCRNNKRLITQVSGETETPATPVRMFFRAVCSIAALALLAGGFVFGRNIAKVTEAEKLIDEYVAEIVRESEGLDYLFTDGAFDWKIESLSSLQGRKIETISMMPGKFSRNMWNLKKLLSGDSEDVLAADTGGGYAILRSWQRDRPEKLRRAGMQMGLEIWKEKSGRAYPPVSGVLARSEWPDGGLRESGIARAHEIADKILAMYDAGFTVKKLDRHIAERFEFMQWRLARLARVRAEIKDAEGDADGAMFEKELADRLDDRNLSLKLMKDNMAKIREFTLRPMSPREGLQFALQRADFILARKYAEPILETTPEHFEANFGMGMSYFIQDQYTRAEEYLQKCKDILPRSPTILNNLAVIQTKLDKLDEAKTNADAALELLPGSPVVIDTVRTVEKAIRERNREEREKAQSAAPQSGEPSAESGK